MRTISTRGRRWSKARVVFELAQQRCYRIIPPRRSAEPVPYSDAAGATQVAASQNSAPVIFVPLPV
jgi:hypothetical protein